MIKRVSKTSRFKSKTRAKKETLAFRPNKKKSQLSLFRVPRRRGMGLCDISNRIVTKKRAFYTYFLFSRRCSVKLMWAHVSGSGITMRKQTPPYRCRAHPKFPVLQISRAFLPYHTRITAKKPDNSPQRIPRACFTYFLPAPLFRTLTFYQRGGT